MDGQNANNVISIADLGGNTLADIALTVQQAWEAPDAFIDQQVVDLEYVQTEAFRRDGSEDTFVLPWDSSLVGHGNVVGMAVPPQDCMLYKLITPVAGRKGRGRLYLPFVGEGFRTAFGTRWDLTTSPGLLLRDACLTFINAYNSSLPQSLVGVFTAVDDGTNVIINTVGRDYIASQDRRGKRYGTI